MVADEGGTESEQPFDLRVTGAVVRLDVEVDAVLDALRLGHGDEQERGAGGLDQGLGVSGEVVIGEGGTQHLGPEGAELVGVGAVDGDVVYV